MEKILIVFMILNSGFPGAESVTEKRNLSDQQSCQQLVQDPTVNRLSLIGDKLFSFRTKTSFSHEENEKRRRCHSVRSEESLTYQLFTTTEILHFVQNDAEMRVFVQTLFSPHSADLSACRLWFSLLTEENSVTVFNPGNRGMASRRKTWLKNSFISASEKGIYETSKNERGRIKRWLVPAIVTVGSGVLIYTLYRVRGN